MNKAQGTQYTSKKIGKRYEFFTSTNILTNH
jgi:hypothetical protein